MDDYLSSHDAVADLRKHLDLVAMFRRREADLFSRIWSDAPTAEYLLQYFRRQVSVSLDADTGITTLKVHAFRPEDAKQIAEALLELGERRVNVINARALENGLAVAEGQLAKAEAGVVQAQNALTAQRLVKKTSIPAVAAWRRSRFLPVCSRPLRKRARPSPRWQEPCGPTARNMSRWWRAFALWKVRWSRNRSG